MSEVRVIISGGGTGGHIYPAIAIANELKSRHNDIKILFVGAKGRMEMEKVPNAGYEIEGLWISGIQRKLFSKSNLLFPFKLLSSLIKAKRIVSKFQPQVVIGTGGFASGPLLYKAATSKIPSLIQEQNSYPGITNKILGKYVDRICVAYEGLERFFPKFKIVKTGNPVRQDLLDVSNKKTEGLEYFGLEHSKVTLLVLGGSLGARKINELIERKLTFLQEHNIQVIWQTGKFYYESYKNYNSTSVKTQAFLNKMDLAYAVADIIVSRAGASSVSELSIVGKPTIFIPSPNVAEDHQTKNAESVSKANAAILIKESDLNDDFENQVEKLLEDKERREELSANIKKLALVNATKDIVDEIEKIIKTN